MQSLAPIWLAGDLMITHRLCHHNPAGSDGLAYWSRWAALQYHLGVLAPARTAPMKFWQPAQTQQAQPQTPSVETKTLRLALLCSPRNPNTSVVLIEVGLSVAYEQIPELFTLMLGIGRLTVMSTNDPSSITIADLKFPTSRKIGGYGKVAAGLRTNIFICCSAMDEWRPLFLRRMEREHPRTTNRRSV